jgi:hypothetical protein
MHRTPNWQRPKGLEAFPLAFAAERCSALTYAQQHAAGDSGAVGSVDQRGSKERGSG